MTSLDGALMARYDQAMKRFRDTSHHLKSGASTTPNADGSTHRPGQITSNSSTGLRGLSNDDIWERIAHLAITPRLDDAPPLTTYRTTSSEHGEIYQATGEYIDWLRRKVPGYGELDPVVRATPSGPTSGAGKLDRFKPH